MAGPKSATGGSLLLLLLAMALLAGTSTARTLHQDTYDADAAPLAMAAAASFANDTSIVSASAAAATFCPCMQFDVAAVAAVGAACNHDPNGDCTNKAEFPEEAARWVAAYYTQNKLWPPRRFAKTASVFRVGDDGQTEAVVASADGVVPQGSYKFNYKLGPFKLSGTIDTTAMSVSAKAEVKILFWWKTIGSVNINTVKPCITLGYPKIVSLLLYLDLLGRALVLNASILGKNVSVKLIRW
jgi:hypothetical protein